MLRTLSFILVRSVLIAQFVDETQHVRTIIVCCRTHVRRAQTVLLEYRNTHTHTSRRVSNFTLPRRTIPKWCQPTHFPLALLRVALKRNESHSMCVRRYYIIPHASMRLCVSVRFARTRTRIYRKLIRCSLNNIIEVKRRKNPDRQHLQELAGVFAGEPIVRHPNELCALCTLAHSQTHRRSNPPPHPAACINLI